jgi:hypothetical protein
MLTHHFKKKIYMFTLIVNARLASTNKIIK